MTILIKMALSPLTFKSYKSQAKMRVLKPEMDAIKEKYEGDQAKNKPGNDESLPQDWGKSNEWMLTDGGPNAFLIGYVLLLPFCY